MDPRESECEILSSDLYDEVVEHFFVGFGIGFDRLREFRSGFLLHVNHDLLAFFHHAFVLRRFELRFGAEIRKTSVKYVPRHNNFKKRGNLGEGSHIFPATSCLFFSAK